MMHGSVNQSCEAMIRIAVGHADAPMLGTDSRCYEAVI